MTKERSVFINDLHKWINLSSFRKIIFKVDTNVSLSQIFKSCHQRCSVKICFLKSSANFTGKHMCWSLLLWKFIKNLWNFEEYIFCTSFKNTHFEHILCIEHLRMAASGSWFLEALNLDMLRDKRRRFNRIFRKMKPTENHSNCIIYVTNFLQPSYIFILLFWY